MERDLTYGIAGTFDLSHFSVDLLRFVGRTMNFTIR